MQANSHLWSEVLGRPRVADAFAQLLEALGVGPVFTMPAESLNPIIDAIRRTGEHQLVVVRNEAAGALMASAYAKLTGTVGVCLGTAGPGATHLPLGTYDATADRAPLLAVTGQVPVEHEGSGYFQEIDAVGLFAESTVFSGAVHAPAQVSMMTRAAARALSGRGGAHLAIAIDVLTAPLPRAVRPLDPSSLLPGAVDDKESLGGIVRMLSGGDAAVLVGSVPDDDVAGAVELLASRLDSAVLVPPEGYGYFRRPRSHPAFRVGPASAGTARMQLESARAVVVVGPLTASVRRLVPAGVNVVQVAPVTEFGTPGPSHVRRLVGDQADLLRQMAALLPPVPRADRGTVRRAAEGVDWEPSRVPAVLETWRLLDAALPGDAVLAVEPGSLLESAFAWLPVRDRLFCSSHGLAAPGFALPGAIGATYAHPDRPVYALATVAGLSETMAELQTVQRHERPVKVVCFRDDPDHGVDPVAFAGACGIPALRIGQGGPGTRPGELSPGELGTAVAGLGPGPGLLEVPAAEPSRPTIRVGAAVRLGEVVARALADARTVYVPARPDLVALLAPWQPAVAVFTVAAAESAALMASAAGKLGAGPGVCVTDSDSDLIMQLNGLYDAAFDGSPVVVVTISNEGHATDPRRLLGEIAVETVPVAPGPGAFGAVRDAVRLAAARRSVVHLDIRRVDLDEPCPGGPPAEPYSPVPTARVLPAEAHFDRAVGLLRQSRRPAILVGRGAIHARAEVEQLAELLDAPVVTTLGGHGVLADNMPQLVGGIGSSGHPAAMRVLRQCDVLLVLGASGRGAVFDLPGRFQCIRVDSDPSQLLLADRPGVGLCGTAREVLQRFCAALTDRRSAAGPGLWTGTREHRPWYARLPRNLRSNGVPPSAVASTIGSVLDGTGERGIVTVDVGLVTLWIYRFLAGDHEKIWTGSFATMGFALPAAIVAARRHPTRPVVAACGDGGICVTMAELATAGRLGLPLTVVVFNNGKLGAIKYEQQVMGWPEYGSHLWNCDFAAYARACSAEGLRVDSTDQLEGALTEAVAARRPYLVEVICDPDELPVPAQGPHPLQAAGVLLTFGREVRRMLRAAAGNPRDSIANRRLRAQKDIR